MSELEKEDYVSIRSIDKESYVIDAYFLTFPKESFSSHIKIKDFDRFVQKLTEVIIKMHVKPDMNITFTHMTLCKMIIKNWCMKKCTTRKLKFDCADNWIIDRRIGDASLNLHRETGQLFYDLCYDYRLSKRNMLNYKVVQASKDINEKIIKIFEEEYKDKFLKLIKSGCDNEEY